jgi:acetyl-CoA carboxylase biotin carboxyl carrier protein
MMNQKEIQDLIKFVAKSGVTEVEIEEKDFKITIKSESKKIKEEQTVYVQQPMMQQMPQQPAVAPQPQAAPPAPSPADSQGGTGEAPAESSNLIEVKSPMIGTFYRASAPDKPLFVEVGDTIKKGDTVCIIEAMKLFNEIESEVAGKVVKVLVDDATPVEYDQPLFLVDPS